MKISSRQKKWRRDCRRHSNDALDHGRDEDDEVSGLPSGIGDVGPCRCSFDEISTWGKRAKIDMIIFMVINIVDI
jgi:hypothetical protein